MRPRPALHRSMQRFLSQEKWGDEQQLQLFAGKLDKAFENANDDFFGRCLRLHLCLPDVKPVKGKGRERIWVADDKSIVAYITQANVRKIFSSGAMSILEGLKVVNLAQLEE